MTLRHSMNLRSRRTGTVKAMTPAPTSGWVTLPATVGSEPSASAGRGHSPALRLVMPLAVGERSGGHGAGAGAVHEVRLAVVRDDGAEGVLAAPGVQVRDRKSTRLKSSHVAISYAVY